MQQEGDPLSENVKDQIQLVYCILLRFAMKHACGILPVAFSAQVYKLGMTEVYYLVLRLYIFWASWPIGRL